jgi:hypothetical protein
MLGQPLPSSPPWNLCTTDIIYSGEQRSLPTPAPLGLLDCLFSEQFSEHLMQKVHRLTDL